MTVSEQITRIKNAKAAIKQAIQNKGVTVSDTAKLDEYPALINSITVGSGDGGSYENPDFYELITKGGTSYRALFYHYAYPNIGEYSLDLSHWDTSKVTTMANMFYYNNALYSVDFSNWDTSEVSDMQYMFYYCQNLTELDIKHFNVSNVTNMTYMLYNCQKLISLDITGWDTSKVTNINNMFQDCKVLTAIIGEFDASSISSGLCASSGSNPFKNCNALETVYLKNIYKDCTMTNAAKWSINLAETVIKDECLIYIIDQLPDLINDKGLTATDKIVLTLPPSNTLTAEQVQVAILKGWSVSNTTYEVSE